jgi:acid phosphatase
MVGILLASACAAAPPAPAVGAAPGAAVPRSAAAPAPTATATPVVGPVPAPDHVVVVVFENKDVDQVLGSGAAPFLDELARTGANFVNAHAEAHPSQPNYLALFAGDTLGVTDNECLPDLHADNLAAQLVAVGRTFVGFSEDLPASGFSACSSGDYAQKHAPWGAFTNLPSSAHQPWSAWPSSFERLPTVSFVIPNLCDDMHDCSVATGDSWVRDQMADYLVWARAHNSLLLVTFDESESYRGDNGIVTIIDGARVRPGPVGERVDHYRLLRTLEAMYGLAPLGRAAATEPITDIWTR